ncbi:MULTISPECIES: histidine phosphatase family protein [Streptomyces]|uniref:Histidine phosphatase family protein n=1 Tax=Streptomyces rhizosphaericola TaxID=2564098 RepID=A0ABY2PJS4_9ACTN|nr:MULTISPECIES: histidine phosphatase family protein [Streptomyces]ARI51694.1 phosphoglycerate mutase [Streptomyces sp. S8]MYU01547.1 histidine phosphatase family protein [Streptomyces sp. SID8350]PWS48835.1 histidine phosphatase family protein [Streptomyces sp. ZEA17I]TGZ11289.1 histidine phosphatase family protein [Streptomyces rhizosphaericola]SCK26045.1 probable phosphoglycerate mutase [Streptomyces sp. AmelKG-D3]
MGELILIRHGETEWSRSGQHTSWTDLPLTATGERQARALVPLLADRNIGLTLVSPSIRARRTAELAGLHAPRVTPELREWDYGGYEGITTRAIRRTRPFWNLWTDGVDPGSDEHPGESPAQVGQRADQVLAGVRSAAEGLGNADIALVAHSHFLRVLTARYLGLTPAEGRLFQLATGAVSRLGTEHGGPVVTALNMALPEALQEAQED